MMVLVPMSEVALHNDFLGVFAICERDGAILLAGNERVLRPGQPAQRVYDLPGGSVEPGELLTEALVRELGEECSVAADVGAFAFVQEGVRVVEGVRHYAWRSFFFYANLQDEPTPGAEVSELLWIARSRLDAVLGAPYHAGFRRWLRDGSSFESDVWA